MFFIEKALYAAEAILCFQADIKFSNHIFSDTAYLACYRNDFSFKFFICRRFILLVYVIQPGRCYRNSRVGIFYVRFFVQFICQLWIDIKNNQHCNYKKNSSCKNIFFIKLPQTGQYLSLSFTSLPHFLHLI